MIELNRNILYQYFLGMASPLQRKLILEWLQEEDNQEIFYQCLEEWERDHVQFVPESTIALEKIMNRLDKFHLDPGNTDYPAFRQGRSFHIWKSGWAAACIILVVGSALYFFRNSINHIRYQTTYGQVKEFALSDGSHVILNANSSLVVPRWGFDKGDRKVELTGEAAFYVKHTVTNQKFLVNTSGQLNVEVLGTEFSVYSRENNNKVELNKGSVRVVFKHADSQPFIMKPGDVVNVSDAGKLMIKHQQPVNNFIAWKDHRFVFDTTPLSDVVQSINEIFGDAIIINGDRLRNRKISGSFKAESSRELLSALAQMFDLEMLPSGDSVLLQEKK